jgi:hypothetical protein
VQPWEVEQYQQWEQQARAIPTRDLGTLTAGWQGEYAGEQANPDWWTSLDPGSPDVGGVMLQLRDTLDAGTASPQERGLYQQVLAMANDWDYRASVPQASDAFNPLGDQFFGALGTLALGATGGLAAAPLAAGGASLATTLGSLGTLAGVAGTGAGVLGQATDQPWLRNLGLGLGIAGGLAGGIGGLTNVLGGGITSVGDAARLAQSAGKVTGALGRIPGADPLQQASRYLGLAGGLGQGASGVQGLLGAAQGVTQGATQGGPMEFDYSWDYGGSQPYDNWSWDATASQPSAWDTFTGWGGDETQTGWYQNADLDTGLSSSAGTSGAGGGSGNWLSSVLGGLGSVGSFLGKNASWLGPAASTLGSVGAGALGARAATSASDAQAAALNRGIDLQTAQWLQSQANQAPWLQAGQTALGHLTGRMAWAGPQQPGATPAISGANYALPSATPGWTPGAYAGYTPGAVPQASQYGYQGPQAVQAEGYRWTPGQGPRASDYRYTPGQTPDAEGYRYTPGAVPTLSGAELLANDPGVAFRLQEGRGALEASAAARGGALSGPALAALQRQGQELSSQEYSNAWQRAAQQAQMREQWGQQATAQNFGQAMSAAQLREQLQQVASQQGWSQAQTEAVFREQMAQQASQQGFGQALQGQQQQWQQGMAGQQFDWSRAMQEAQQREQGAQFGWQAQTQAQQLGQQERQQYDTDLYNRMMGQSQTQYGRDVYQNQTDYERQQQAYQQQIAELTRQWNQFSGVAGLGQVSTGQLGQQGQQNAAQMGSLLSQLGTAQGLGELGPALAWQRAIGGATNNASSLLAGLNR